VEPLHATAVVVDGRGIAFVGHSGFGKSTLAAAFLNAGHRLLTDDLLVVEESGNAVIAFPGAPRIKLFPKAAERLLPGTPQQGVMNSSTPKRILAVAQERRHDRAVPLEAIYLLADPRQACRSEAIRIQPLTAIEKIAGLMESTFNRHLMSTER